MIAGHFNNYEMWIDLVGNVNDDWWWSWSNQAVVYENWGGSEPNFLATEHCSAQFGEPPTDNHYWINIPCSNVMGTICETEGKPSV